LALQSDDPKTRLLGIGAFANAAERLGKYIQ
jgi:hypothetical protein